MRYFTFFLVLNLLFACKAMENQKEKVDLIIENAKIYTVDSLNSSANSFAIKDGKFVAVGDSKKIEEKYSSDSLIDAKGLFIYPGFIDAHCHFLSYGRTKSQLELEGTA